MTGSGGREHDCDGRRFVVSTETYASQYWSEYKTFESYLRKENSSEMGGQDRLAGRGIGDDTPHKQPLPGSDRSRIGGVKN